METKNYTATSKSGEKMFLHTDETYTLALSDCADVELAQDTKETTPRILADIFAPEELVSLREQMNPNSSTDADSIEKINLALGVSRTNENYEVINAYSGKNVAYSDSEFAGTREACEEFISNALAEQRKAPGMDKTGTFLAVRNADTFEWL